MTNTIAHWIAVNGRPINIVDFVADEGLQGMLPIAAGNRS